MTDRKSTHEVLISLGSNIGEKLKNCRKSIDALTATGRCGLIQRSRFYRTEPVGYKAQAWFVNGAVKIRTDLDPWGLFQAIKKIERAAGRKTQTIRYGPRIIDLDILLYGEQIIATDDLTIPHPRMHKRRFVLMPVCDIDPDTKHPVLKKTMRQLLEGLDKTSQEVNLIS